MSPLTLKPLVSEKSLASAEKDRTYIFIVPRSAAKIAIAQAVGTRFKVKVAGVRTAVVKGKPKTALVSRGRRRLEGKRSDFKKAYVKLAAGETIKLFDEPKPAKKSKTVKKEQS